MTRHVADTTALPAQDALILMEARGKTVLLPTAYAHAGLPITVKNTAQGSQTTIVAPAGQTIDGADSYKLVPALAVVRVESDGVGWWITARG